MQRTAAYAANMEGHCLRILFKRMESGGSVVTVAEREIGANTTDWLCLLNRMMLKESFLSIAE